MSERDRKALEYPFDKYPDKDSSWRSVLDAVVKLKAHIAQLEAELDDIKGTVEEQAKDVALWYEAETASEQYVQDALRFLHGVIERDADTLKALGIIPAALSEKDVDNE